MTDKFRIDVGIPDNWAEPCWPLYFENFWLACVRSAGKNNWAPITVANYELKPLGGKLIMTSTQGWYLRWDDPKQHTMFVLKWA